MPSASTKAESKASPEVLNPIKIAVQVVEKKVRNLEKRKGKLDGYKEKKAQGSTLSTEQEEAISRYNGVVLNLELAKELHKQMLQINVDAEKAQKKQLKRERAERVMQDMRRTRELLNIQNILDSMGGEQVRDDFTEGRKGAVKLTEDNLNHLDELYKLISPTRETEEPSYEEQLAKASEHLSRLLDAADKPVLNTTYKDLKGVLDSINECGYFSNQSKEEEPATAAAEEEAAGDAEEGSSGAKDTQEQKEEDEQEFVVVESGDLPEPESEEVASSLPPMVAQTTVPDREPELQQQQQQEQPQPQQPQQQQQQQQQPQPQQPEAAFVDDSFFSTIYANKTRPFSEIVSSVQGNFNFLQDSEIDMDAPQMDPAVVALAPHPIPHPPSQQATESSLAPQSYGQGLMNEEQQTQQQQQVSQHASLSASQQAQVSQQQQQTPPPQQYTATAVSQAPSSSIVNQADLENTYSAPSDYSQNLMSQNHPASALHSTQLADSGAAGSQLSFGSMPNSSSMGEAQASDVPAAIPMPNQTPYGNSQSAQQQQQPSQQQQQQSSHQNQGMSSGHPGYPSSSVNQSYSQQQAAELSQTEDFSSEQVNNVAGYDDNTKKFSMNANAAVFQSMYHNPNSVQQGQGMQQGMGSGSEDGKSDSQQQNEYQGSNSYGNGFQRGGGNRGNSRGSYNGRGGRGGMSNGFRGNSRGGGGGNQYNSRGNYSNGRGNNRGAFQGFPPRSDYRPEGGYQGFNGGFGGFNNKRGGSGGGAPSRGGTLRGGGGAMRGGPPRGGSRGGRGSFNGNSNRSNMGQQQQPQQATA